MSQVKVSVCMPVYNGERFLREAIDSVLQQSFTDFEFIIVDNQSTDKTVEIIKSYTDPRIKFFQNETNIGLIPNWNMAMSKASGQYMKVMPADDLIYPDNLKLLLEVLDKDVNKRISMVCSRKQVIDETGRVILTRGYAGKTEKEIPGLKAIHKNIRSGGNIIGEAGAILFRREILAKTGVFNSKYYYVLDIDLWYKILQHGNLYYLPKALSAFRVSSASESTVIKDSQLGDIRGFNTMLSRQKELKVSFYTLQMGSFKAWLSSVAKKLIYRFLIKK
jgi:glycosyltransferase involved in cell wall biosynthesis